MPFDLLSHEFSKQIKSCGTVLVVATPFYGPLVVERAWCVYEVVVAWIHGVPVVVVLPRDEEAELLKRIQEEGGEILIKVMTAIASSKAKATVAEDLENILRVIESKVPGGHPAVDAIYKRVIRQWVLGMLNKLEATFDEGSLEAARFAGTCGNIMRGVGDYDKAIEFYEKALGISIKVLGKEHTLVSTSYTNLGIV
jgi:tetratricopeptide (TPR) repeat protein